MGPSLYATAKKDGSLPYYRPQYNPHSKRWEPTLDKDAFAFAKEQYAEAHPKGTSPEERVQATEERKRQFEEKEYDRQLEYNRKQDANRLNYMDKWESKPENKEPSETTSSTLGFGGGEPNPEHEVWQKRRDEAQAKAEKAFRYYVPRKAPQENAPAAAPAAAAAAGGAAPMPGEPPLGPDEYRAPDGSHRKKRK